MINYDEDWIIPLLFRSEGSLASRALIFAVPATIFAVLLVYIDEYQPGLHADLGIPDLSGSQLWNVTTGVLLLLLGFRTRTAFSRFWEGTSLLHQMRGEWFDTVSNCVTFSISAKSTKPDEVNKFRHTLVRLMSLCHGSALEEIAGNQVSLESIDVRGLDISTLIHLERCHRVHEFNKVEIMLHLVQSLITKAHDDGVLKIPPPILSRVYQTISRGFVNLLNAKKITDTRFPFPYAQTITGLLFVNTMLTPMMISQAVRSKVLAAIFTFIPIFGMYATNFIASELENPFGLDANDLPLHTFQEEMNSCLLMLLHPNTDMVARSSPRCISNFNALMKAMIVDEDDPSATPLRRLSDYQPPPSDAPMVEDVEKSGQLPDISEVDPDALKVSPSDPSLEPTPGVIPVTPNRPSASPLTPKSLSAPASVLAEPLPTPLSLPKVNEEEEAREAKDSPSVPLVSAPPSSPPVTPKARQRLQEEEAARLEELQHELEQRINAFYLALQRWTLMMESQVKQIREMLDLLRLLSTAVCVKSEGWEAAMHPI